MFEIVIARISIAVLPSKEDHAVGLRLLFWCDGSVPGSLMRGSESLFLMPAAVTSPLQY